MIEGKSQTCSHAVQIERVVDRERNCGNERLCGEVSKTIKEHVSSLATKSEKARDERKKTQERST